MAERQKHGFDYQNKIILNENLIGDYHYSDKWDAFDPKYNLPCSIKCIGIENSIELGDFKRQQNIDYDFILYVGFWQKTKTNIIEEYKLLIKKENWTTYFGDISITENMLLEMKNISNNKTDDSIWKNYIDKYKKLYGDASILLRFKRDHKKQKRIQCAINYKNFMNEILLENTILRKITINNDQN